jgi:hypothetical protein
VPEQSLFLNSREISNIPQTISHPIGFVISMSHLSHFQFDSTSGFIGVFGS